MTELPFPTGTFFATVAAPCPYLEGRLERKLFTKIPQQNGDAWANALSRAGFRRSHNICYLPACPKCASCVSVRIDALHFVPTKKQKKVVRQNADLRVFLTPNVATEEQYNLFRRYLAARHRGSEMNVMGQEEYRSMIEDNPVQSLIMEVRHADTDVLKGAMVLDVTDDGLSAVYSFFEPDDAARSLGTFMILQVVSQLRHIKRPYAYLGYYIAECSNMAYKKRFRPLERFEKGHWVTENQSPIK